MMKRLFTYLAVVLSTLSYSLHASTGFVSNQDNNTVSVIDSATGEITHTITVGSSPVALALSRDESTLYVANSGSNSISVIDTTTYQVTHTLESTDFASPNSLAIDPKGEFLAVGNGGNNNLVLADLNTTPNTISTFNLGFSTVSRSIDINPQGNLIYVPNSSGSELAVINMANPNSPSLLTQITVGSTPSAVAVSPSSYFVAVANKGDNTVSILSSTNNRVLKTLTVGSAPSSVSFNATSTEIYVTNSVGDSLSTIALEFGEGIEVGEHPTGLTMAPNGQKLYVRNVNSNSVSVIDPQTYEILATVGVDLSPSALAITPDSSKVYVINTTLNRITVIDTATYNTSSINLASSPANIAIQSTTLLVTLPDIDIIQFIDTSDDTTIASRGGQNKPTNVVAHPTQNLAYVLNKGSHEVAVVDVASQNVIKTLPVGLDVYNMALTPNGSFLYVINRGIPDAGIPIWNTLAGSTNIIDTSTNTNVATPKTGVYPSAYAATSNGGYIYIGNGPIGSSNVLQNTVFAISTVNNDFQTSNVATIYATNMQVSPNDQLLYFLDITYGMLYTRSIEIGGNLFPLVTDSVKMGNYPSSLDFTLDSQFVFVSNRDLNSVSVLPSDPNSSNPIAVSLFNTKLPILLRATVMNTATDNNPEVVVPDTPIALDSPPILPGVPTPLPTLEQAPNVPEVPQEPPAPVCSCSDAVWIVNSASNTVTIRRSDGSGSVTVLGLDNPSDIVVMLKKEYLLKTVFTLNEINHAWCSERFANLLWSGFPGALEYKLYRNNEFLASFDSSVNQYQDHNLEFNKNYTYTLYICTATGALQAYQFELIENF